MALFGRDKKIAHLRKIPLLQGCTQHQLVAVARISDITEVPAGKLLALAGEPGDEFFIILDGTARGGGVGPEAVAARAGRLLR